MNENKAKRWAYNPRRVGPPIFVAGLSGCPGTVRLRYAALTSSVLALSMVFR